MEDFTGNEYIKISENIRLVARAYGYDVSTATLNRKVSATAARESLTQHEAQAMHTHMSHAPETSMQNYQFPELQDSVDTYESVKNLQSRKYFSPIEDKAILKEWPLENKIIPSLKSCRAIADKHRLQRTAKQVQDRWKTLSKNIR